MSTLKKLLLLQILFFFLITPQILHAEETESIPLMITEVMTQGQTSKDEFIEIYNPNSFPVSLLGFSLIKKTASGNKYTLVELVDWVKMVAPVGISTMMMYFLIKTISIYFCPGLLRLIIFILLGTLSYIFFIYLFYKIYNTGPLIYFNNFIKNSIRNI